MIYTIKKGNHKSGLRFCLNYNKKEQTKAVVFKPDCVYLLNDIDQHDINKLFGWSSGLHHKNSARFGWLYNQVTKNIELHTYCYINGIRDLNNTFICYLDINKPAILKLEQFYDKYIFTVEYKQTSSTSVNVYTKNVNIPNKIPKLGYNLYPYFGGNNVAPNDIHIELSNFNTF